METFEPKDKSKFIAGCDPYDTNHTHLPMVIHRIPGRPILKQISVSAFKKTVKKLYKIINIKYMNTKFYTILTDQKFIFEGREIDLDVTATKLKNHRKLQPKIPVLVLIDTVGKSYPLKDCLTVAETVDVKIGGMSSFAKKAGFPVIGDAEPIVTKRVLAPKKKAPVKTKPTLVKPVVKT